VRLKEPSRVSFRRRGGVKRRARTKDQRGRRRARRPRAASTRDQRARRGLESSERREMVVPAPARQVSEVERVETGRHRSSAQSRESAVRFRRGQLPVGIARAHVAREGPQIDMVGDGACRPVYNSAGGVASDGSEFGRETNPELRNRA
jgi:hypothetical protein